MSAIRAVLEILLARLTPVNSHPQPPKSHFHLPKNRNLLLRNKYSHAAVDRIPNLRRLSRHSREEEQSFGSPRRFGYLKF